MSRGLTWLEHVKLILPHKTRVLALTVAGLAAVGVAHAQADTSSSQKTKLGATGVELNLDAGWAFKLPDTHATLSATDGSTATARITGTKLAPSAGVRFWAVPWMGVSVDVLGMNSNASTRLDTAQATVNQHLVAVYVGVEGQRPRGGVRPYAHFGGGPLRFSDEIAVSDGQSWMRISQKVTAGSFLVGGGLRFMCSRRWGVRLGADLVHFSANDIGAHTFGRVTAGFFFHVRGRPDA